MGSLLSCVIMFESAIILVENLEGEGSVMLSQYYVQQKEYIPTNSVSIEVVSVVC